MSSERVERRLAAILAADVAGYSRLMGEDDAGTLARLRAHRRELIDPKVAEHKGRIVKTTGDGILIEFPSVVEAVACALAIQRGMVERNAATPEQQRIVFRVGINLGDVIVEDGDIHGDGVNVAARLEGLAEPGSVCISAIVHGQVAGRLDCAFDDLGEQQLKNITRPVRVYRVAAEYPHPNPPPLAGEGVAMASANNPPPQAKEGRVGVPVAALPLPDKPSIAVLPFQNMSGDPEQEYFADGMVEEIITALSRIRWLFVIARNSSFTYKGQAIDVKRVGRELGVRYVLEGSVRKNGGRVRITAQLIEAETGTHLWADRFDRELLDIFAVQDEITGQVAAAVMPTVARSEREQAMRKPSESLTAWEHCQRGLWHCFKVEAHENEAAKTFLKQSIELDPGFAAAHSGLALASILDAFIFQPATRDPHVASAEQHARVAIELDPLDAGGRATLALSLLMAGRHEMAINEAAIAISLNSNDAWAYAVQGAVLAFTGHAREALSALQSAMRLSPFDPLMWLWRHWHARAEYYAGDYEAAAVSSRALCDARPLRGAYQTLIAALVGVGRLPEARCTVLEAREKVRDMDTFGNAREVRPADAERLRAAFKEAGLGTPPCPEKA